MIVLPDDTTGPARARLNPRVKLIVGLVVYVIMFAKVGCLPKSH